MAPLDPTRFRAVERAFDRALDLEGEARDRYLDELGRTEPALAAEVAALLAADARADGYLEAPLEERFGELVAAAAELTEATAPPRPVAVAPAPAQRVGAYRLIALLGRGGMGEVWEAEPEARSGERSGLRVALKRIRHELDSAELLRRFAREREILAGLDHPAIARLIDAGRDDGGRPYVVLEKVDGLPITEHVRALRLPLAARLELAATCCEAVAAAHRARVVHRDLKPGNVLVTATGEVKLLDFGIARPLDGDASTLTRTGWHFATLDYAAPEQILGHPPSLAADVWSLGALLFELATGRLPHRRTPPRSLAALAASLAAERPQKPSQVVLAAPPADLPEPAARWAARLTGGLDAVLLRALAPAPGARQANAGELAIELRRELVRVG